MGSVNEVITASYGFEAAAAEQAINITKSLIDLAKIENDLSKEITVYVQVFYRDYCSLIRARSTVALTSGMSGEWLEVSGP